MKQIKLDYEQPSCDLLVVRFKESLLTISGGEAGKAGQNLSKGNVWSFDEED